MDNRTLMQSEEKFPPGMMPLPEESPADGAEESLAPMPVVPRERYDLRILRSMRRIIRSVDIHSRKLATEFGVTVPQLLCMLKIDEIGAMTLKELSREVYLNPSTLVGIVDRLEKQGVFARERSVKDRRKIRISLTAKGREMLARAPSTSQESLGRRIEDLTELERATIALSLERILELLEPEHGKSYSTMNEESAPILETGEILGSEMPEIDSRASSP